MLKLAIFGVILLTLLLQLQVDGRPKKREFYADNGRLIDNSLKEQKDTFFHFNSYRVLQVMKIPLSCSYLLCFRLLSEATLLGHDKVRKLKAFYHPNKFRISVVN